MLKLIVRLIRIKFLLSSLFGVTNGLALSFLFTKEIDLFSAFLTYAGVASLHASVDILNDYWDYKRGIDKITTRTKFSGGTGILPENKVSPKFVLNLAILFFIIGISIGIYFIFTDGIIIFLILTFASLSIYFYSSLLVNYGLGEIFVMIKGALIVIGTFYIQTDTISNSSILLGLILGSLSFSVLLVTAIPDYYADKKMGRKTMVIIVDKKNISKLLALSVSAVYSMIVIGIFSNLLPFLTVLTFAVLPYSILAIIRISCYTNIDKTLEGIGKTIIFSRFFAITLATCLIVSAFTANYYDYLVD